MRKRLPYCFIFFLAVLPIARAQVQGAAILSHDYDAAKNTVTLHMLNQSDNDVTAFDVKVTETYENGQVNTHWTGREMLGIWLTLTDPSDPDHRWFAEHPPEHATWRARTALDFDVGVSPGLKTFEAALDTVIYADKTAETTNSDALNRFLVDRKNYATSLEAENVAIQHALADRADASPHETARKEIEASEKAHEAAYHIQTNGQPSGAVLDLQNAPSAAAYFRQTIPDYLNSLVSRNAKRASLLREHAAPTVVNTNAGDAK